MDALYPLKDVERSIPTIIIGPDSPNDTRYPVLSTIETDVVPFAQGQERRNTGRTNSYRFHRLSEVQQRVVGTHESREGSRSISSMFFVSDMS